MSESEREQIAQRLRRAREAAGLSQGQVAKMMALHRPTLSEIEAGRRRVSAEELKRLAEIYGVSVEWITSGSDEATDADDRISLAARQLSKMSDADLDRLMTLLRMLRKGEDTE